jgi:peroxiredoxin
MRAVLMLAAVSAYGVFAIGIKKEADRKKAPEFDLKDSQGRVVRLSDFAGKVVLLDFWATWCAPCKESVPWFNELQAKYADRGFTVLAVSMDEGGWPVVKPFAEKAGMTYPVLLGTPRVAYLYGDVDSLPLAFFIDRAGRVAAIHLGPASRKDYDKVVRALLSQ